MGICCDLYTHVYLFRNTATKVATKNYNNKRVSFWFFAPWPLYGFVWSVYWEQCTKPKRETFQARTLFCPLALSLYIFLYFSFSLLICTTLSQLFFITTIEFNAVNYAYTLPNKQICLIFHACNRNILYYPQLSIMPRCKNLFFPRNRLVRGRFF